MFPRRIWALGMPLAGVLAAAAFTGSASAATQTLNCRASVARVSALNGTGTIEPWVANPNSSPCMSDSAGITTATPLDLGTLDASLGGGIAVGPAEAVTSSSSGSVSSLVSVNAVSIPTLAGAISIVGPAQVTASDSCSGGSVQSSSSSSLSAIQIGSQRVALGSPGAPTTIPLDLTLGLITQQIGTVSVNQNFSTATSNTERLLEVDIPGVADIVVGEAAVSAPASGACPTNPSPGPNPGPVPPPTSPCPAGTTLDPTDGVCVLSTSSSTTSGSSSGIAVSGVDSSEIVGGSVISLARARRLYGARTACLTGAGPKFVVVGTNGNNRITVSKRRMRVLALGGKDRVTVKGGNGTCVNGGAGNDTLINRGKNRVSLYGGAGNDRILVGKGPAYLNGGSGADRITAGNGAVKVIGGAGNDVIKVGSGADVVSGGAGHNRITARGLRARVSAQKGGRTIAYVTRAAARYAARHGVWRVHVIG